MVTEEEMLPVATAIAELREKTGCRLFVLVAPSNVPDHALLHLKAEVDHKLEILRDAYNKHPEGKV